MEEEGDALQSQQQVVQARHIKKRSLKNKALSVSFNEKDLSDFVTGFHKRKKKRRKEAQSQQQEALRRKRIELRKKRKLEREYVIYSGAPPGQDGEANENGEVKEAEADEEDEEEDDDDEHLTSVSGTKVYDTGSVKVMVTTSEISREDDALNGNLVAGEIPKLPLGSEKKVNLPVIKKKPMKRVEKKRSRPKTQTKRDKRKGKKVEKRR
ncbi:ribosomal RNA-processing protein 17 [Lactuca sativa]|uniref:Ribosomal RNA-processing protein 17 n=1 Tax=Lactuca sativa TaxID=4236 RepID=A0A9R1VNM2_LACSA|nr:ribosomal RNA-processing protein 17 [Lactuca sativa]KAJ0209615.1 hypothetical protein LSAT_V11C400179280 [Lactuca sativa]